MRRGFALITTLLLLTLLIAVAMQLTTTVTIESVVAARRANDPAHELAVDSAVLVLADRLRKTRDNPLMAELDRLGETTIDFPIGTVRVCCQVRDDGAKFSPLLFHNSADRMLLERKLGLLTTRLRLPDLPVRLRPIPGDLESTSAYRWFDQLVDEAKAGDLFDVTGDDDSLISCWSDAVTFWGDGRIDLRRISPEVLEVALEDVRPGLAGPILTRRRSSSSNALEQALIVVDAEIRQQVGSRLTYDVRRYAVTIETTIAADRRRWYVVATFDDKMTTVHHRSQLLW